MTGFPYPEALPHPRHFAPGSARSACRCYHWLPLIPSYPAGRARHLLPLRKEILRRRGWRAVLRLTPPRPDAATLVSVGVLAAVAR